MRPVLKFVNLRGRMGIYDQLKIEELFMRHQKDNWYLLNTGIDQPSVVLGISGKVHELVNLTRCMEDKVPLIRRFSGGRLFSSRVSFFVYISIDGSYERAIVNITLIFSYFTCLFLRFDIRWYSYRGPIDIIRYLYSECKYSYDYVVYLQYDFSRT